MVVNREPKGQFGKKFRVNEFTIKRILEKQEYKYKAGSRPENITSKFVRQWSL